MKIVRPQVLPAFPAFERRASFLSDEESLRHFLLLAHKKEAICDCDLCKTLNHFFSLKEYGSSEREKVEDFIKKCFADAYSASVSSFMPRLFRLTTRRGEVVAAFGIRSAQRERLFLETYLDASIEQVIESKAGIRLQREQIVEVGNLAAIYPGAVRWLFVALTVKLYGEGYEWVVFTGTPALCNVLKKLGLHAVEIGPAKPERLAAEERACWGTYYDTQPKVMAGNIRDALHVICSNAGLLLRAAKEEQVR